jgi:hypothetical protein
LVAVLIGLENMQGVRGVASTKGGLPFRTFCDAQEPPAYTFQNRDAIPSRGSTVGSTVSGPASLPENGTPKFLTTDPPMTTGITELTNRVRLRVAIGWVLLCALSDGVVSVSFVALYIPLSHRPWSSFLLFGLVGLEGVVAGFIVIVGVVSDEHFSEPNPVYLGDSSIWGYLPDRWGRRAKPMRVEIFFQDIRYFSRWGLRGPVVCAGLGSARHPLAKPRWFRLTPENFVRVQSAWSAWRAENPPDE